MRLFNLNVIEVDEVNEAILANIDMGISGDLGGMAIYAIGGGISSNLTSQGFAAADALRAKME